MVWVPPPRVGAMEPLEWPEYYNEARRLLLVRVPVPVKGRRQPIQVHTVPDCPLNLSDGGEQVLRDLRGDGYQPIDNEELRASHAVAPVSRLKGMR